MKRRGTWAAAAALVALAAAYSLLLQPVGCNQTAHYALVQSLADGTPRIDRYHGETCDTAYVDGHYYAAKAPGLAFVTLPWYLALDAVGAAPENPGRGKGFPAEMLELPRRAIWQLHLWSVLLPALALLLLVRRAGEQLEPGTGRRTALLLGLATLVLPFATDFFAHVLSATLGFAAFTLLLLERGRRPSLRLLAAAGLVAGLAIVVEYSLVLVAAALGAYALFRASPVRRGLAYGAGLAVGVVPLLLFNQWAFGSVTRLSYENAVIEPGRTGHDVLGANDAGLFGVELPSPRVALELLFAPKGLLILTPVLALAGFGVVLLHRRGRRAEALLIAGLGVAFLVFNSAYATPFGGFVPGPRFLIPALPFLVLALAPVLRIVPGPAFALGTVSVGAMVVATAAEPMLGGDDTKIWLRGWERGDFTHSVVTLAGAGHGWLAVAPFLAAVGAAAAPLRPRLAQPALSAGVVAAWAVLLLAAPDLLSADRARGEAWGALALVAVVVALGFLVWRGGAGSIVASVPLAPLLAPDVPKHTLLSLALASLALALVALIDRKPALSVAAAGALLGAVVADGALAVDRETGESFGRLAVGLVAAALALAVLRTRREGLRAAVASLPLGLLALPLLTSHTKWLALFALAALTALAAATVRRRRAELEPAPG